MTLPSSISAPSTLVPMISAVSGSTTEKPKSPSMWLGQSVAGGCASFSRTVTSTRISGGIANRNTRLRPIVARSVIDATTLLCTPNITIVSFLGSRQTAGRAPSGLNEVGEHALQRFILGQQFAEPDALLPGERGELPAEGTVVGRPHLQAPAGHLHPGHRGTADQGGTEPPVIRGADEENVWPARHQPPDGPEVAGRGQPPGHDHLDGAGQPFHLLQDVRAEQDGAALVGEPLEQVHHVQALPRVHPVERLVQPAYLRFVPHCRRLPQPLAHSRGGARHPPSPRA